MLLKLDKPKVLSDIISIISELVTEVKIRIEKTGLVIAAIDPANVAFIHFKLPAESFSMFEAEEEILGLNLDSLKSILRRCNASSSLVMQTEDNFLKMQIQDKIKRNFSIALIEIDTEEKAMPNLEFLSKIEINSGDFVDAIEDCSIVADSCAFVAEKDFFSIEAQGLNSAKVEFSSDEAKIETKAEKARSKYSLEYLQKFIKARKLSEKVIVSFSDDYPLRLDFKLENAELSFILAPRFEEKEE